MKQPTKTCARAAVALATLGLCTLLTSCSVLGHKTEPPVRTYTLDGDAPAPAVHPAPVTGGRVLLVEVPHAAPGYDSAHMVYVRQRLTQEAFADSAWTDTPARMLAPLLVTQLQNSGQFRAVLLAPTAAKAGLRLDTTILRLQQDFLEAPSSVRLTLQLTLMDSSTREVLAWRTVDVVRSAQSEDAAGGAQAAQAAVREGLQQVAAFLQAALVALPVND